MIKHEVLSDDLIEFEVDPSHDNNYETEYSASLTREQILFLLEKIDESKV